MSYLQQLSLVFVLVFIIRPTTGLIWRKTFLRWVRSQGKAHTHPALPKIPLAPLAFPLLGAPQVPGNKPNPTKEDKACGDGLLRPEEITSAEGYPARSVPRSNTPGRSATQQLEPDT